VRLALGSLEGGSLRPEEAMSGTHGRIFISYRHDDTAFAAGRLSDRLEERFPDASVFMDVDTIEPGADFTTSIRDAISDCDVLIAVIGSKWLTIEDERGSRRIDDPNDFLTLEIATALDRGVTVIPIPQSLSGLARRNAVRLGHATFRIDIERILPAVDQALNASFPTDQPSSASEVPPPGPEHAQPPVLPGNARGASVLLPTNGPSGESPKRRKSSGFPIRRMVGWCLLSLISFWASGSIANGLHYSGHSIGPGLVCLGVSALIAFYLYRLIINERKALDEDGFSQDDPVRKSTSSRHVRLVAIVCVGSATIIGALAGVTIR
jgi:hypothetical protein